MSANDPPPDRSPLGLIIAGGLARRMGGGDKTLRPLAGQPILAHIIARLAPQVAGLVLSANGDPARFAAFGLDVLPDAIPDHPGPLAGLLAGLDRAVALGHRWVVSVPADAPFLPLDLVARLQLARCEVGAPMAMAATAGRDHPLAALWPVEMRDRIRTALSAGQRRVMSLTGEAAVAIWPDMPNDPFLNVNTPADLAAAELVILDVQRRAPPPSAAG